MSEPNYAAKEIASYIFRRSNLLSTTRTEREVAEGIQEMIDKGNIQGGLVVTGDHETGGKTVLDWSPLGNRLPRPRPEGKHSKGGRSATGWPPRQSDGDLDG